MKRERLAKKDNLFKGNWQMLGMVFFSILSAVGIMFYDIKALLVIFIIGITVIILCKPWYGFLLMVFFIPFTGVLKKEIGIGLVPSQIIGVITLGAFLIYKKMRIEKLKKMQSGNILLLFFSWVIIISLFKYPQVLMQKGVLWGGPLRNSTGRTFIQIIALGWMVSFYFLTINILNSKERVIKTIKILLITTFLVSLFGLYQFGGFFFKWPFIETTYRVITTTWESSGYVSGVMRVASTVGEAKNLSYFLLTIIFLLLVLILLKQYLFKFKWIPVLFLICAIMVFVLTFSRSGFILFIPCLILSLFLVVMYSENSKDVLEKICKFLLVFIITYLITYKIFSFFDYNLNSLIVHRCQSIPRGWEESIDSLKFNAVLKLIPQHFIFGVGWGNAPFYLPQFGMIELTPNQYLNILFESGIIGLGIFFWFIGSSLSYTFNSLKKIKDIAWRSVIIALLSGNCVFFIILTYYSYWFNNPYLWIMMGMLSASVRLGLKENEASYVEDFKAKNTC
jgi:O-antigen ligase